MWCGAGTRRVVVGRGRVRFGRWENSGGGARRAKRAWGIGAGEMCIGGARHQIVRGGQQLAEAVGVAPGFPLAGASWRQRSRWLNDRGPSAGGSGGDAERASARPTWALDMLDQPQAWMGRRGRTLGVVMGAPGLRHTPGSQRAFSASGRRRRLTLGMGWYRWRATRSPTLTSRWLRTAVARNVGQRRRQACDGRLVGRALLMHHDGQNGPDRTLAGMGYCVGEHSGHGRARSAIYGRGTHSPAGRRPPRPATTWPSDPRTACGTLASLALALGRCALLCAASAVLALGQR